MTTLTAVSTYLSTSFLLLNLQGKRGAPVDKAVVIKKARSDHAQVKPLRLFEDNLLEATKAIVSCTAKASLPSLYMRYVDCRADFLQCAAEVDNKHDKALEQISCRVKVLEEFFKDEVVYVCSASSNDKQLYIISLLKLTFPLSFYLAR